MVRMDFEEKAEDFGWAGDVRQMLEDLHWQEQLTPEQVGRLMGCSRKTVSVAMKKLKVRARNYREAHVSHKKTGPRIK